MWTIRWALAASVSIVLAACSSSGTGTDDPKTEEVRAELRCEDEGGFAYDTPTYADLHTYVIAPACGNCHHGGAGGTAPDMSRLDSIRDVVSPRYAGAKGTLKIVDPGSPENSTLVLKVLGGAPKGFEGPSGEAVGEAMPQVGTLSASQKDAIRNWICAGANP